MLVSSYQIIRVLQTFQFFLSNFKKDQSLSKFRFKKWLIFFLSSLSGDKISQKMCLVNVIELLSWIALHLKILISAGSLFRRPRSRWPLLNLLVFQHRYASVVQIQRCLLLGNPTTTPGNFDFPLIHNNRLDPTFLAIVILQKHCIKYSSFQLFAGSQKNCILVTIIWFIFNKLFLYLLQDIAEWMQSQRCYILQNVSEPNILFIYMNLLETNLVNCIFYSFHYISAGLIFSSRRNYLFLKDSYKFIAINHKQW